MDTSIFSQNTSHSSPHTGSYYSGRILSQMDMKNPKKVGGMFEANFYRMYLKEIRESEEEDSLFGSRENQQRREMRDEELSHHLGMQGRLGVADLIEQEIAIRESIRNEKIQ